jgi:hypothetical protein
MFDFQIRDDAILARNVIMKITDNGRPRPWMG